MSFTMITVALKCSCHRKIVFQTLWRYISDTSGNMNKLFQSLDHAQSYTKFRPVYPKEVLTTIIDFYEKELNCYENALDIGCGSGQSTVELTKHFKNVIGMDVSEAQISQAPKSIPNLKFLVGEAENLSFEAGSIDLITVAQAMHWMDTSRFYASADNVLKPGGVLAVYGYGQIYLDVPEATHALIKEFHNDLLWEGGYWNINRRHVDNMYKEFTMPFRNFTRIENGIMKMEKVWRLSDLLGYISTWSGYRTYMEKNPTSTSLEDLSNKLKKIYGKSDEDHQEIEVKATWPVYMLLGRK